MKVDFTDHTRQYLGSGTFETEAPHVGVNESTGEQVELVFSAMWQKWVIKRGNAVLCFCTPCLIARRNEDNNSPGRGNIYYGQNF